MNFFTKIWNWILSLFGKAPPAVSLPPGWSILYSPGMPAQMAPLSDGTWYFDFPQTDGVHYVVQPVLGGALQTMPVILGRTITMQFTIRGTGVLVASDGGSPVNVRLMLQQRGDNLATPDARWWSAPLPIIAPGDYMISAPATPEGFPTAIGGGLPTAGAQGFLNCLVALGNIGFTFGGWSAGHGVYAQGPARFILKSFTIS